MAATLPTPLQQDGATAIARVPVLARWLPWLTIAVIWLLLWSYRGIDHDAMLYAFQALGRMRPDLYSHDVFLAFGSQDDYTLFSPLFVGTISVLGLEPAAALLTFLSTVALLAACWFLARTTGPARYAVLGLGLVITLPTDYGPSNIFHYIEGFLTPRLLAEAFATTGVALSLARRNGLAVASLVCGALIHPVMTAPAVALTGYLLIAESRPRLLAALVATFFLGLALFGLMLPENSDWKLSGTWLKMASTHAPYVFLGNWAAADWNGPITTLATLSIGLLALPAGPARRACAGALFATALCLVTNFVGCDLFKIGLIAQAQGYRCLWIGGLISVVVLPSIAMALWRTGRTGQAALFVLAATWLLREELYSLMVGPLALAVAALTFRREQNKSTQRIVYFVGCTVLGIALLTTIANTVLESSSTYLDTAAPEVIDRMRTWLHDRIVPMALLLVAWCASQRVRHKAVLVAGAALLAAVGGFMLPYCISDWTHAEYGAPVRNAFAAWRAQIPVGESVLWPDFAFATWVLLERPSYYSTLQTATALFSRKAAEVLERREKQVMRDVPGSTAPRELSLKASCAAFDVHYLVTDQDLHAPYLPAPAGVSNAYRRFRLYKCADSGA